MCLVGQTQSSEELPLLTALTLNPSALIRRFLEKYMHRRVASRLLDLVQVDLGSHVLVGGLVYDRQVLDGAHGCILPDGLPQPLCVAGEEVSRIR
jgi:hypothetical protein